MPGVGASVGNFLTRRFFAWLIVGSKSWDGASAGLLSYLPPVLPQFLLVRPGELSPGWGPAAKRHLSYMASPTLEVS
ncbi:hypothetical protein EVAR_25104_1 [Eumeta japonica]|uniref:Uncharacterized protein n=1 Tax=Eumeta variegata TaxID=151549 RepID=A0A4C1ZNF5_EUMVA|nr:hypothetical protein EVAR_25104_1 [Eumeta japonica]